MDNDTNGNDIIIWLTIGYSDYIAARCLLNNGHYLQGAVLASTAIEKYLKGILTAHGKNPKWKHINSIDIFKQWFNELPEKHNALKLFDPQFLKIITIVYDFRYVHGNFKEAKSTGFVVNQFLCELDHIVYLMDRIFTFGTQLGATIQTPLKRAITNADNQLFLNNHLANKIPKEECMLKPSMTFGIAFHPETGTLAEIGTQEEIIPIYPNQIMTLKVNFESPQTNEI